MDTIFTGFDSAWTRGNRGAIAHARLQGDSLTFIEPTVASFPEALAEIETHAAGTNAQVIGIDQPLIVPNLTGSRPVEAVFRPLLGRLGGAIQPSNRGRADMFGDSAPIWGFLNKLSASNDLDPDSVVGAMSGRFSFEIYPAAALVGLFPEFLERGKCAKYNPARRKSFALADWVQVCRLVGNLGHSLGIAGMREWAVQHAQLPRPRKADQDCLDAAICVLITYLWWRDGYGRSIVAGDTQFGYIVTPTNDKMTRMLKADADRPGRGWLRQLIRDSPSVAGSK